MGSSFLSSIDDHKRVQKIFFPAKYDSWSKIYELKNIVTFKHNYFDIKLIC